MYTVYLTFVTSNTIAMNNPFKRVTVVSHIQNYGYNVKGIKSLNNNTSCLAEEHEQSVLVLFGICIKEPGASVDKLDRKRV